MSQPRSSASEQNPYTMPLAGLAVRKPAIHWPALLLNAAMLALLVAFGVAMRLWFEDLPNFAPVAALSLFAGYYFRHALVALAVPLAVMMISDWRLGAYTWQIMVVVYAALAAPILLRGWVRKSINGPNKAPPQATASSPLAWSHPLRSLAVVFSGSVAGSILFFATTNFATWYWFTGQYEHSWAGLANCYVAAVPFFRFTLYGDLFFAAFFFGGHLALCKAWQASGESRVMGGECA